jgi:uncharacterized protein YecT (DUF1311 family)
MRKPLVPLFVLAFPALCFAQDYSKQFQVCNGAAKTQGELNLCASVEATLAEEERLRLYQAILARLGAESQIGSKVRLAEQSWIRFRDAHLDALYPADDKLAAYGSLFFMEFRLVQAKLTWQHVEQLKNLLEPDRSRADTR